ncbi:XkdQ/YqbQ family protein [Pelosinus propionicus]|uniref:YqbQ/XkdQ domain-containing protein n=1 Tax=Pelosinus propionicus DSM 13327 TaxID=1123291 RepID=A0A1I4QTU9_9FIRM|nr:hypothetical protein [Pelosinus propionicus]SFM43116.1 hypothetical protein SAMN04490355_11311 [Pelosinus propionicus DSM 13327]
MIKYEFLIESKQTGNMYDASELIVEASYHTVIRGQAGKFQFELIKDAIIEYHEGDVVRFKVNDTPIFYGYVFSKDIDRWGRIKTVCYDQLRYLKAHESYVFSGVTATSVIKNIAQDFSLTIGVIEDTGYTISSTMVQDNKSLFDIIYYGLQQTQLNTGELYIFYDDFGALTLTKASNMYVDVILGTSSLVTDYSYKTDIDKDTYNKIKLVHPNKKTGKGDVYIVQDSTTMKKWGTLQKYEVVDENLNAAQIQSQAETCLTYYNRVLRTLKLDNCLGVVGLKAGHMVTIDIPDIGDISLSKKLLLDSVDHRFGNGKHVMSVGMRVII